MGIKHRPPLEPGVAFSVFTAANKLITNYTQAGAIYGFETWGTPDQ
jgi:hypothetical protein